MSGPSSGLPSIGGPSPAHRPRGLDPLAHRPSTVSGGLSGEASMTSSRSGNGGRKASMQYSSIAAQTFRQNAARVTVSTWPSAEPRSANRSTAKGGPADSRDSRSVPPELLVQVNKWVARELAALPQDEVVVGGGHSGEGQRNRLRVYCEVFSAVMGQFRQYQPLMAEIKAAYDDYLSFLESQLSSLEPLESSMVGLEGETTQVMNSIRNHYEGRVRRAQTDLVEAEREKHNKDVLIASKDAEIEKLRAQVAESAEQVQSEFERSSKFSQELMFYRELATQNQRKADEHDDIRANLMMKEEQLETYTEQVRDEKLIKREVLLAESGRLKVASVKVEELEIDLKKIKAAHTESSRNEEAYRTEVLEKRELWTPRPNMRQFAQKILPKDKEAYTTLGGTCSSVADAVFTVFDTKLTELQEITERLPNEDPVFSGYGMDYPLPFLRYPTDLTVPNTRMSKKDCEETIKNVWKDRGNFDSAAPPFTEFFKKWLASHHKNNAKEIATAGYNIYDACKRYMYDADVEMFFMVVSERLEEAAYHDEIEMFKIHFPKFLSRKDCEYNASKKPKGKIEKGKFPEMLMEMFPGKSQDSLDDLTEALHKDEPKDIVPYKKLFAEDKSLDQRLFAEKLRDHYKNERKMYFVDLKEALDRDEEDSVTAGDWRAAFIAMDEHIPKDPADRTARNLAETEIVLEDYICRGFGRRPGNKIPASQPMSVHDFMINLKHGSVKRWSR